MKKNDIHIMRQQLDKTIARYALLKGAKRPTGGWIRSIREALGMSGKQLAKKLNVSAPRVTRLEQDERHAAVTLKTMKRVAQELDCEFVYALVPRESLENTVRSQAERFAARHMRRASHTMLLEAQSLNPEDEKAAYKTIVDELVREMPRELWDADDEY